MRLVAKNGTHGHIAVDSLSTRGSVDATGGCGRGGIGRRAGFRSRSPLGVEVRVLSPAPIFNPSHGLSCSDSRAH